jgi:hypothetical protein
MAPGGHNNISAFQKSTIPELINKLPISYYVIGNNAYIYSNKLLTSFLGENKNDPVKDAYNYYVSQLRI